MRTIKHGTANEYCNFGCRCEPCRKAWAIYVRKGGAVRRYMARRRAAAKAAIA